MVTYEAMNMLFQFGVFLATAATAIVANCSIHQQKKVTTLR
ncbi:putative holin-like toxin [Sporosarcina cascadiensis]|nr:putative holin-like toxin [Sporosarcina cascadiensis]